MLPVSDFYASAVTQVKITVDPRPGLAVKSLCQKRPQRCDKFLDVVSNFQASIVLKLF